MRGIDTARIWERSHSRFAGNVLGPNFESVCREWTLYFAGDRFGDWPAQVAQARSTIPSARPLIKSTSP